MNRPVGVIVSAVLLLPISLLQLAMGFLMAMSGTTIGSHRNVAITHPGAAPAVPYQAWMPAFAYATAAFFLALAIWGISTLVGLLRMRTWARQSVLIIAGCMALTGLLSLLGLLVVMAIPFPGIPGADPARAHAAQNFARIFLAILAIFHAGMLSLGVFWLVYFNLKAVKAAFVRAAGGSVESPRPFLISLIAVGSILGGILFLILTFLPLPALFVAWILHGGEKVAYFALYSGLELAAGFGLWRLEEWGRRLKLALIGFGAFNSIAIWARPSIMLRYSQEFNPYMNLGPQPQLPGRLQALLHFGMLGVSLLFLMAIVTLLHHYRGRFMPPATPQHTSPQELA
jgi:hypothetical protein